MCTAVEKIFQKHVGRMVRANDIVVTEIDGCMVHDVNGPAAVRFFREIAENVKNPERQMIVLDHFAPSPNVNASNNHQILRQFAREQGIRLVDVCQGVCHQVMLEAGMVRPGGIVVGTDSHSCTYGALNAFSTGIGAAEAAVIFAGGKCWFRIPETIRVEVEGSLPAGVTGKDIILEIIRILGEGGANYRCLEFGGTAMREISFDQRVTMCNMAIECGAKGAIMPCDSITLEWMRAHRIPETGGIAADPDAQYFRKIEIDISKLRPLVAVSPDITHVVPAEELHHIKVDQVVLGSCTNGRYEDFLMAAEILEGRHIAPGVRMLVFPASPEIQRRMQETGIDDILSHAGAAVFPPNCGPCAGLHLGLLGDGEVTVTTTNRNNAGRMGSKAAGLFVASSVTAAYSALNGFISAGEGDR